MSKKLRGKSGPGRTASKAGARAVAPAKPKAAPVARRAAAKSAGPTRISKASSAKASAAKASSAKSPAAKAAPALLQEGAPAPAFTLPRDGGAQVALADFAGRKLVLFFYPRANTPGCTREAMDFSRLRPAFAACGTDVLGLSADTVKAQDSFRDKHKLSIPLASDEQKATLEAYGAWGEKSLYGRKFLGVIRTTVLVDARGRVARIWRNVKVDGHADAVLAAARQLCPPTPTIF